MPDVTGSNPVGATMDNQNTSTETIINPNLSKYNDSSDTADDIIAAELFQSLEEGEILEDPSVLQGEGYDPEPGYAEYIRSLL